MPRHPRRLLRPQCPFDPPIESEPSTAYYGGKRYESQFGKAKPDNVPLNPRYLYDPILVHTPLKRYVARVWIDGKDYQSEPADLVASVNLIAVKTEKQTRYVPVGAPTSRAYQKD